MRFLRVHAARWYPSLIVVLGVFSFRWSVAQPYVIPSPSMEPTLIAGDYVAVTKFAYDLKFPFTDWVVARRSDPRRGDVIVFRDPRDPSIHLIKRLVGLPGDRVRVRDGEVWLDDRPVPVFLHEETGDAVVRRDEEQLGDRRHAIQRFRAGAPAGAPEGEWVVPADSYFFLGDFRDNSADSRYWGFARRDALQGRAELIWFSREGLRPRFERIGARL